MTDEPSIERFYQAQERREREREWRRHRLANAVSLADFHEIKLADAVDPTQQTANVGYPRLKLRP